MYGKLEHRVQLVARIEPRLDNLESLAGVRRIGVVRIPLGGPYRPKATLYRMPDGRSNWCLRLWHVDHAESRCVDTSVLLAFARRERLPELEREIEELVAKVPLGE